MKSRYRFRVACGDKTKIVMNLNVQNQAILLLFINSKVYGLIIKVSSSGTACTSYAFCCSTLITFGF